MKPDEILHRLVTTLPIRLTDLPPEAKGVYGLTDHEGHIRYIGMTDKLGFRSRVWRYHVTGEGSQNNNSHKFSQVYNVGRMYKAYGDRTLDAEKAKKLRSDFCREFCRAVFVALDPRVVDLSRLDEDVQRHAPPEMRVWEKQGFILASEPEALPTFIHARGYDTDFKNAIERQALRWAARYRA